jgi:hypothetical protein
MEASHGHLEAGVGGIAGLVATVRERFGALEADFQAHYRLDLRCVLYGPTADGVRRIKSLVDGLPSSALVWADEMGRWTRGDQFDALAVELLDCIHRDLLILARVPRSKVPKPLAIPRPWNPKPSKRKWIREWAAHATGRRR